MYMGGREFARTISDLKAENDQIELGEDYVTMESINTIIF